MKSLLSILLFLQMNIIAQERELVTGRHIPAVKSPGVVLWFHGGMRSGNCAKGKEAWKPLLSLSDSSRNILASPSACAGHDWLSADAVSRVDAFLDSLNVFYGADLSRLSLAGVSDGTLMVIRYSLEGKYPVSHRLLASSFPELVVNVELLQTFRSRIQQGSWSFFQGGNDRLFPAARVFPFLRYWARNFSNVRLFLEKDGEHDWSWWSSRFEKELRGSLEN